MVGRGSLFALVALAALGGCAGSPPRSEPGSISAPPAVDPRAVERVTRVAREVRAWLAERYGPPRTEAAAIRLVPDAHWFADEEPSSSEPVPGWQVSGWQVSDPSIGVDEPPTILLAPCFGVYGRAGALARWIFHVEWTRGLPPWLREGLADTVAAAFAADAHADPSDATLELVGPSGAFGAPVTTLEASEVVALDASAARSGGEAARIVSAGTEGGEPSLVRVLLDAPPRSVEAVGAFLAVARVRAARAPTLARLVHAMDRHPRSTAATALLEAATPAPGTDEATLPDAARDRGALEAKLAELAGSPRPEVRQLALHGLGRLGARADLVTAAGEDPSFHVRVTALGARARLLRRGPHDPHDPACVALARKLLELAKDGPLEEAPGRPLPALELFDALTGFAEAPPPVDAELTLGLAGAPGVPASYRAIEAREAFLHAKPGRGGR